MLSLFKDYSLAKFDLLIRCYKTTILGKTLGTKQRNPVKLDRKIKV